MAWYVDTSAFLKLVVAEAHSPAMRRWAEQQAGSIFSSDLLRAEALRAARRHSPAALKRTRQWLQAVTLVTITSYVYDSAAFIEPATLRTLDSLHLAAALAAGDDLEGIVTYDDRLTHASDLQGLAVLAPA